MDFYTYVKETSENVCFYFMKETSENACFYFMTRFFGIWSVSRYNISVMW